MCLSALIAPTAFPGEGVFVEAPEELDVANIADLEAVARQVVSAGGAVTLQMSRCAFLDHYAGVRLETLAEELESQGSRIRLVGCTAGLRRLIGIIDAAHARDHRQPVRPP